MGSRLPHLTFITFSGAHGTGKTTLAEDLRRSLFNASDTNVAVVDSCSSALFELIRTKKVRLPKGTEIPQTYDDINRMGLRAFFQRRLPDSLAFGIESTVLKLVGDRPYAPRTYVLADRWFPDIYAYTEMESADVRLHVEIRKKCNERLHETLSWLASYAAHLRVLNIFVPLAASDFHVPPSSKFRATCDRAVWEGCCLRNWNAIVGEYKKAQLRLTKSGRTERVNQILEHLSGVVTDRQPV